MKKLISLIKASMTEGMNVIKMSGKKKNKSNIILPLILTLYIMFAIGSGTGVIFDILSKDGRAHLLLVILAFSVSLLTFIEGVYKAGPLLFNCKDDDLLLSLPLTKGTIIFIRILKFYVFELLYNSLFLLPIMISYIPFGNVSISYYVTSIIMLLLLPVIPIVLSCLIGMIMSSISSRFKHKNIVQTVITMAVLLVVFYFSFNIKGTESYLVNNIDSLNENISKFYYPAGIYGKLVSNFNIIDLIIFILINLGIFGISIFILSKTYFKINTRLKSVSSNKKSGNKEISYNKSSVTISLIKKELKTFVSIPVFIINSGFGLVLFLALVVLLVFKLDSLSVLLEKSNFEISLSKDIIMNNLSIVILVLLIFTSFMTSITNSVISLEGRNINILKSLPVKVKTILMSKVYACLLITTPVLLIGDIVLFIKCKTNIIEALLLVILSILMPLVSHLLGIIINLKHPKLDAENTAEVVKQSTSSFIAVMLGMFILMITIGMSIAMATMLPAVIVLLILTIVFGLIDLILYLILKTVGVKNFNKLSI